MLKKWEPREVNLVEVLLSVAVPLGCDIHRKKRSSISLRSDEIGPLRWIKRLCGSKRIIIISMIRKYIKI